MHPCITWRPRLTEKVRIILLPISRLARLPTTRLTRLTILLGLHRPTAAILLDPFHPFHVRPDIADDESLPLGRVWLLSRFRRRRVLGVPVVDLDELPVVGLRGMRELDWHLLRGTGDLLLRELDDTLR